MNHLPEVVRQPRKSFFQKRDPWKQGVAVWVLALILFCAPLAVSSLRHVRLDNNVENWLPENDPSSVEYLWCREHFPEQEKVILTWEGSTATDLRLPILVAQLSGKVDEDGIRRGGLPYVQSVIHAGDLLTKMIEFGVPEEEAIRRIQGTFIGTGRVKIKLTEAGRHEKKKTIQQVKDRVKEVFQIELAVFDPVVHWEPSEKDETFFEELSSRFLTESDSETVLENADLGEHDFQISWAGLSTNVARQKSVMELIQGLKSFATVNETQGRRLVENCYMAAGSPIAVVVTLSDAGKAEKTKAIAAIRQAAIDSFIPDGGLIVGGRVVAAAELNNGVLRAAWNPGADDIIGKSVIGFSGLVGILFALFSLRSYRLGLIVIGVAYYAALLGTAIIPLSGGTMNMVLVVMPTLLMVLALSGAIHVVNYWKHAVWENPETAVADATRMASQPCLMAAFTTSLGLISLLNSDLIPVQEFGVYASIGCLISVAMVLYGLPALLQMIPLPRCTPAEIKPRGWMAYSTLICNRWLSIGLCSILISLGCSYGLTHFDVETKVIRYFPNTSAVVKDYETIEETLAGISPIEILVRFNSDGQQQLRFLERIEMIRKIEAEIRRHPEVSGAVSLASFMPTRTIPENSASTREKILFNRRSNETERRVKEDLAAETGDFIAMNRLPTVNGDELWRINAQAAILSDTDYNTLTSDLSQSVAGITRYHAGVDHVVTGTVPLFLRTQRAVLDSLITSSLLAFGLIACVMIWVLKDPVAGMISMLPNLMPVVSVFGLVSWFGHKIDIGTMVTASVAMGIAVDGTLHLLTWFREGIRKGLSRENSVQQALLHCGPAMWQTSAAVGVGLLVLFPAELLLISRFGWLMALLILAAFLGDMVLLPCMLVGPLGAIIERRCKVAGEIAGQAHSMSTDLPHGTIPAPHHKLRTAKRKIRR